MDKTSVRVKAATLQRLAKKMGKDALLDEMESSGISRWTANEMLKGTYLKSVRTITQNALLRVLKRFDVNHEDLFSLAPTCEGKAS